MLKEKILKILSNFHLKWLWTYKWIYSGATVIIFCLAWSNIWSLIVKVISLILLIPTAKILYDRRFSWLYPIIPTLFSEKKTEGEPEQKDHCLINTKPLSNISDDYFEARLIAENILDTCRELRKNKLSTIISVTGSWGCGKTTVLNFIKKLLPNSNKIIDIDFIIENCVTAEDSSNYFFMRLSSISSNLRFKRAIQGLANSFRIKGVSPAKFWSSLSTEGDNQKNFSTVHKIGVRLECLFHRAPSGTRQARGRRTT